MPIDDELLAKVTAGTGINPADLIQNLSGERVGLWDRFLGYGTATGTYLGRRFSNWLDSLSGRKPQYPVEENFFQLADQYAKMYSHEGFWSKLQSTVMLVPQAVLQTGMPLVGATMEALNYVASNFLTGSRIGAYTAYTQLYKMYWKYLSGASPDTVNDIIKAIDQDKEEFRQNMMHRLDMMRRAKYGILGSAVNEIASFTNAFQRTIRYEKNGKTFTTTADFYELEDVVADLQKQGATILEVQEEPTTAEKVGTLLATFADIVDPTSNAAFAKLGKWSGVVNRFVISKPAQVALSAMAKNATLSAMGAKTTRALSRLGGAFGVPLTAADKTFSKIFAIASRKENAKVEFNKRFLSAIEQFVFSPEEDATVIQNNTELQKLYGEDVMDSLMAVRQQTQERIQRLVQQGVPYNDAVAQVKAQFNASQAWGLFFNTGLPFNEETLSVLKNAAEGKYRSVGEVQEALHSIKANWSETEAEALKALIYTNRVSDLRPLSSDLSATFADPVLRLLGMRTSETVDPAFRILFDTDIKTLKDIQERYGIAVSKAAKRRVDRALPFLSKEERVKAAAMLSLLEGTTDINERQAIINLFALYNKTKGGTLEELAKALKVPVSDLNGEETRLLLSKVWEAVSDEDSIVAKDMLDTLKQTQEDVFTNNFRRFNDMMQRLQKLQILGDTVNLAHCAGGLFMTTAPLVEAVRPIRFADGSTSFPTAYADLAGMELKVRQNVLSELAAKGLNISDIPDREIRMWLNGDRNFFRTAMPRTVKDTYWHIRNSIQQSGIDWDYLTAVMDMQETLKKGILKAIGGDEALRRAKTIASEQGIAVHQAVDQLLHTPKALEDVVMQTIAELERDKRYEDAYQLQKLLETHQDYLSLGSALMETAQDNTPLGHYLRQQLTPTLMLYHVGKNYALEGIGERILNNMMDIMQSSFPEATLFTENPTPIHSVKLTDIPYEALRGKYTTPYIAAVLNGLFEPDTSLLKHEAGVLNSFIKMTQVVWSPMAILRDFVSNMASIAMGMDWQPHEWYKLGLYYHKALQSVLSQNEDFVRMAKETPSLWGATTQITTLLPELERRRYIGTKAEKALWTISSLPVFRNLQYLRGLSESIGKMAIWYAVEDVLKNTTPEERLRIAKDFGIHPSLLNQNINKLSTIVAEKYMIDYHDVPIAVKWLRQTMGLFPYITWESKMLSNIMGDMVSGRRLGFFLNTLRAIGSTQRALSHLSDPDPFDGKDFDEAVRQILPDRLSRDPLLLMWKSGNNVHAISLSWWLPYGVLLPMYRLMNGENKIKVVTEEIKQRLGGIIPVALEIITNRDLFTGKPIVEEGDPYAGWKFAWHIAKEGIPILPPALKDWAGQKVFAPLEGAMGKTDENLAKIAAVQPEEGAYAAINKMLGIYMVNTDEAASAEYERKLRKANSLLNKAKNEYSRLMELGQPAEADRVYEFYMREADRAFNEAQEMAFSAMYLSGQVKYDHWKDPTINPVFDDLGNQFRFLQNWYDYLRSKNMLPQNTTKEEIAQFVIQSAEQFYKGLFAQLAATEWFNHSLDQYTSAYMDKIKDYPDAQRQSMLQSRMPIPPVFPDVSFEPTVQINPMLFQPIQLQQPQGLENMTWTHPMWQPAAVQIRQVLDNLRRLQPTQPVSIGGTVPSQAGRPVSNPASVAPNTSVGGVE